MAQQTYTPKEVVDPAKERDWAYALGCLDWDNTAIVFTKRSFVEFLRYQGTTIDPNWGNVSKLPRYAQFGTIADADGTPATFAPAGEKKDPSRTTATGAESGASTSDYKPSRRVTSPPGGKETNSIFSEQEPVVAPPPRAPRKLASMQETPRDEVEEEVVAPAPQSDQPAFKPTRRVREAPGGHDSLKDLI
ncbi:hypothetical protein EXIGLDRAFT_845322 [Exidia glandulosa HHB12029]|uniref:Uncharacterized protein n=1 Tax=Exidia glandulosa HHB12029 TaxID=1314781 RepID=A0A165BIS8_EXIGL|nr:hypothetical protein EXIGLDRAFT_845322 [Exidia glandulosa HHB12029]